MSRVDLSEFISGFLAETDDHLRSVNANLLLVDKSIQQREANPRAVRELFRSLHTIKGLAGMVGVEPIVDIAHAMERVLREAEQNGGRLSAQAFEPLLQGTKAISQRISLLAAGKPLPAAPLDVVSALDAIGVYSGSVLPTQRELSLDPAVSAKLNASEREQLSNVAKDRHAFQVVFTPSAERAARGTTITSVRERLGRIGEIVKVVPVTAANDSGSLSFLILVVSTSGEAELAQAVGCASSEVTLISQPPLPDVLREDPGEAEGFASSAAGMLRVEVPRVDAAIDGIGELLVTKFRLSRAVAALAEKGVDVRELQEITEESQRKLRDLRALVLALRMVSLAELFDRLPILVRGLQTTTGKTVQLRLEVGRFEVDKSVGERLWPVLVHLIRNAVDHGLESETERLAHGKSKHGTILVRCTRSSNSQLELTLEDDGAGIEAKRVAERAGQPVPNDDAALLDLITRPGFSTRDTATATSGRGMGLDIARRLVVDELGGELKLRTAPGQGTCFTLKVPVTVAVIDTFRFESAMQTFLVPVASVEELVQVEPSEVASAPLSGPGPAQLSLFTRRGRTMPFIELWSIIGAKQSTRSRKAIIVKRNDQFFAFGVDRMIDHQEVIVRRLIDPLVDVAGVAGAADLGDGKPTLLLDLMALAKLNRESERAA